MQVEKTLAIHEAGHAVCAHTLGKTDYAVRIFANGSGVAGPGDLSTPPDVADYTPATMETLFQGDPLSYLANDAAITAGGAVAEALLRFDPITVVSFCDRQLLAAGFQGAFPGCDDCDAERAWAALAIGRARDILRWRWTAVEKIADELVLHGAVSAARVAEIMGDSKESTL